MRNLQTPSLLQTPNRDRAGFRFEIHLRHAPEGAWFFCEIGSLSTSKRAYGRQAGRVFTASGPFVEL